MKRRGFLAGIIWAVAGALSGCGLEKERAILQMEQETAVARLETAVSPSETPFTNPPIYAWGGDLTVGRLRIRQDQGDEWLRLVWEPTKGRPLTLRLFDGGTYWKVLAEANDAIDCVQERSG